VTGEAEVNEGGLARPFETSAARLGAARTATLAGGGNATAGLNRPPNIVGSFVTGH